ncbi:ATP-binding protein [Streptomyces sp. NPDC059680]|uniref:ATP-binding protein n=1 Tax=Streptomyces sp. NPDC059680 TaxID=3346904 RepID=UPI003693FC95
MAHHESKRPTVLITAGLVANAVRRGHVPGRDLRLRLTESSGTLRLEVCDTRTERLPGLRVPADESGRGLLLVAALADKWGGTPPIRLGGGMAESRHQR